jgi:hypothetical protein
VLTGRLLVTLRPQEGTSAHASANAVLARAHARRTSPLLAPLRLFTGPAHRPGSLHALATRLRADPTVATSRSSAARRSARTRAIRR